MVNILSSLPSLLQRLIEIVGWTGISLLVLDWICQLLPLEVRYPALLNSCYWCLLALCSFWPCAVWLRLRIYSSQLWLRATMAAVAIVATIAVVGFGAVLVMLYNTDRWIKIETLYVEAHNPQVEIVLEQHYNVFWTVNQTAERIVKHVPVLGLWQRTEPVDTTHFDAKGWQRVKQ